jgi:epoxyqueuosine reductase
MDITNQIVIEKAKELGFDLIGFARAEILELEIERLNGWLGNGYHAGMEYMSKNVGKRRDIREVFGNARSVISLALNYYTSNKPNNMPGYGKVSRYAWGNDYHIVIWEKLKLLEEELKKLDSSFDCLSYVDTGPVMDKSWAVRSGIGWLGKNTNVINSEIGSWIFLATLITNLEFDYGTRLPDMCGSCTACIDSCPTGAIVDEYIVDSNKCISYLTIENKGEISREFRDKFDNWVFGCDTCQDVCPWNKKFARPSNSIDFEPDNNKEILIEEILEMEPEGFKSRFELSPIKRAKLNGMKRNAEFIRTGKIAF